MELYYVLSIVYIFKDLNWVDRWIIFDGIK